MFVRVSDPGTKFQIVSQSHRDTLDLAEVLNHLGYGSYDFRFIFPKLNTDEAPRIEFRKMTKGEACT